MRERLLLVSIGMLVGSVAGFVFAGSIKQSPAQPQVKMPAAVSDSLEAARRNPGNFEAQMKAAELYYQIRRYDEALMYLLQANRIQPDNFETMASLGMVNLDAGHLEDAGMWLKLALNRQPDNATILEGYGALLLQQGHAKEGREVVFQLEKLDPDNPYLPQLHRQLQQLSPRP